MKKIFFIFFFLISFVAKNQNLVPNPSFEQMLLCPTGLGQFDGYVKSWYNTNNWTPNYCNSCALISTFASVPNNLNGCFQKARTGYSYAVLSTFGTPGDDHKEYISVILTDTLELNKKYIIGFYLSLTNGNDINSGSTYAIDRMGVYFTDTIFHFAQPYTIPVTPQVESPAGLFFKDTLNWMLCSFEYIAQGNEKCITIGNFHFSDSTNYIQVSNSIRYEADYYIDDVFVYAADEVQTAEAGNNITICKGDSVKIGMPTDTGYTYHWLPATGLSNDTIGDPWAQPTQTTTYYLHLNKYLETIDSVTVFVKDCSEQPANELIIINAFTPNNDGVNDIFHINGNNVKEINAKIFNRWGQELYKWSNPNEGWNGKYKGKEVSAGTYFYVITVVYEDGNVEAKKGAVTLVR